MSHPPPLHDGTTGGLTATVRGRGRRAGARPAHGNRISHLSPGATTGGVHGPDRYDFAPGRSGPDPHLHRTTAEAFFVLSGGIHGFRNESGEEASMLTHVAPGAAREECLEGPARIAAGGTLAEAERAAFMEHHDHHGV